MTLTPAAALDATENVPATARELVLRDPATPEPEAQRYGPAGLRRMARKARKQERKLRRNIAEAEKAGRHAEARWLQKRYLHSFSARFVAAERGNEHLPRHRRVPRSELRETAAELNAWHGTREPVLVLGVLKRSGGIRAVHSFGLRGRALQYLVDGALQPFARLHPGQYMFREGGGRDAACAQVMRVLEDYKWVVSFDVVNCFPSFDPDGVARCLPLPRRVTEECVVSRNLNVVTSSLRGRFPSPSAWVSLDRQSRKGIPQGSAASSRVAEMLLAQVLAEVPRGAEVVTFADNILVFTRTKAEADAISITLRAAFLQHPIGSLRLRLCDGRPRRVCDGFSFLGYSFRTRYGAAKAKPAERNTLKFNVVFRAALGRADLLGSTDYQRIRSYVLSWCAAFELWETADACRELWLRWLAMERSRQLVRAIRAGRSFGLPHIDTEDVA